jgi:hypothetical protein
MKKVLILLTLCVPLMHAQPHLDIIGGVNRDFGEVFGGLTTTRNVLIANTGSETLRILKIEPECGCTTAAISSTSIAPNDTASMAITFNSKSYFGKVEKKIAVSTNDMSATNVELVFSVMVTNIVQTAPEYLLFYNVKIDSPNTQKIKLRNVSQKRLRISRVISGDSMLKARILKKDLRVNEETDLIATFHPNRVGTIEGEVILQTDSKKQPRIPIRFIAVVIPK